LPKGQEEEKNCIESALAESKGKISGDFGAPRSWEYLLPRRIED
jgi:hypothetical protein